MKKYILRNRHSLLVSVVAVFLALILLESGLSGRKLFSFEIDNSFLQLRVNDPTSLEGLEILENIGINIES